MSDRAPPDHLPSQSLMVHFLNRRIDQLRDVLSQKEIARALGYPRANIISMFKSGETKVPLDKIPDLAEVLQVDVAFLMRLWLEQHWPGRTDLVATMFQRQASPNEQALLDRCRRAVGADDLPLPDDALDRIEAIIAEAVSVERRA